MRNHRLSLGLLATCALGVSVLPAPAARADDLLVGAGATWSYLDDGSDQGAAWRAPAFDDSAWGAGPAQLGYGDGDEATVVGFGPDPANKFVTTYFRHSFPVADPGLYAALTIRLLRDDGAVVYLNGAEVARSNMPAGAIDFSTFAAGAVGGAAESSFFTIVAPASALVAGSNVLAVEVHQAAPTSSDISLDLELLGNTGPSVIRGPYLQLGTPSGVVVRWRTNLPTDARVRVGLAPGSLGSFVDSPVVGTEHEVALAGLAPGTRYYYSVGSTTAELAGNDANHNFRTSPGAGAAPPIRVWVIGDSGTANADARLVRDDYVAYAAGGDTDVWLMLGDNAYPDGTDERYQAAVFDTYPGLLRNTVLWPTPGNHDAEPNGVAVSTGTGPYFDLFTLPDAGQAGGLASGTEAYYAFDYANVHFVSLNSTGSDRSPGSAMLTWLENDLASTDKDWIIAYWHHPPYTRGSHDSDDPFDSEGRMFDMRENVLPILEAGGVDLVLSGHSHSYERSMLIDGHYGVSKTLAPLMIVDGGDGREDGDGVYRKQPRGTVYVVAGSSGLVGGGTLDHPVMYTAIGALGSLVLDVSGGRLDATFLSGGGIADRFTLVKSPECIIEMTQPDYAPGEMIEASSFRLRNRGSDPTPVELKVWFDLPATAPLSLINLGADGTFVLPAGFDAENGPVPFFAVTPDVPAGGWAFGCRMLDPVTGLTFSEAPGRFEVIKP